MVLTKEDKDKLSTRNGMLNYLAYCRVQMGIPWFHKRYVTEKKLSDKELKKLCKDFLINTDKGVQWLKEVDYNKRGYDRRGNGYWKKGT